MTDFLDIMRLIPGYDPWDDPGDYVFDEAKARHAIDFFPACLSHIEGPHAGEPFHLMDWQQAIVGNLFGWVHKRKRTRRYRTLYLWLPRKNGKTTLCAGIALYMLVCDGEKGAQIYSAAATKEQAGLCFKIGQEMVEDSAALSARLESRVKALAYLPDRSFWHVLSGKAHGKHGLNTHLGILDEVHEQQKEGLIDAISTSTGSRSQPLMIYATTADHAGESPCNAMYGHACSVRDGIFQHNSILPVIYEVTTKEHLTEPGSFEDPAVWAIANPGYGQTVYDDYFKEQLHKIEAMPSKKFEFLRLHLNVQTNLAELWIPMDKWNDEDGCARFVDIDDLAGQECWGGLDLASTQDIAAFVLAFPQGAGYTLLCRFWIPEDTVSLRTQSAKVPYQSWVEQGYLRTTEGATIDHETILEEIYALAGQYQIRSIAVDRWRAVAVENALLDHGCDVVQFGQGYPSFTAPCDAMETAIIEGELRHMQQPVLTWMASNTALIKGEAEAKKISKLHSEDKIDGVAASLMAMGLAQIEGAVGSVQFGEGDSVWL